MKTFTHNLSVALMIVMAALLSQVVYGQSVLDPNDAVVTYSASAPPTQPAWGTIGKWVRTKRVSWNTNNWKCYVYNGIPFRLRFPKSYNPTANDGKKYPILVFFHGAGEGGPVTDNEEQLFHGGQIFDAAVTAGTFDGYVLCLQTPNGFWGEPVNGYVFQIIDYMIANNKLDPFRISTNGLSAGGEGTWEVMHDYSNYVTGDVTMSWSELAYEADTTVLKYMPLWLIQGGLDGAPDPGTSQSVVNAFQSAGADITYTVFPNDGHDTWDDTWKQANFWPFVNASYASNPYTLFGHNQWCPGATINATIGVSPGYQAYKWRYNGAIISGATSNSIKATALGTYDCQVERNNIWSDWSHTPVVVATMPPTTPPTITMAPLTSNVIPALDTSKGAVLSVPTGYSTYLWQAVGGSTTLSTTNTLYTTTPGQYHVQVMQQFGCSSSFSNPFTVINAKGPNPPSAPAGLQVTPVSQTSLRLDWTVDPSQQNPQTGFEVYQGTASGGPYKIVALLPATALNDTVSGLLPGGTYYYVVRAVNASAGSPASNQASGATIADVQPPTAPANLTITGTTRSTVSLSWTASTDNVAVTSYDIYVNGVKNYSTTGTTFTVPNLEYPTSYGFSVVARDFAKNISPFSNQVTAEPLGAGLTYKFYTFATAPTVLPDYGSQIIVKQGNATTGISLSPETQTTKMGFLWEGYLHITTAGNYAIKVTSVDGADVYLGALNALGTPYSFTATPTVKNDGVHTSKAVTSATLPLQVGVYPIAIAYFHGTSGSPSISVQWTTPSSGIFTTIPTSAFVDVQVNNGTAPAAPSNLVATVQSYNKIALSWTDNSTNETGFEVWRSTSPSSGFTTIGTVGTGVTSFIDSTLSANSTYYYEIRGINQYGASAFVDNYTEALFSFDNNYNDGTGNGHTLTALNSPTFDASTKQEGTAALKLNGTSQAVTINNTPSSFLQTSFTQRTIAGWIRPSATTGNRVIFDIGGSDNGLSLLLGSNTLVAGVASGNSRATISTSFNTTNAWTHVAVVYLGDTLQLYVNGVLAASNNALAFHSISTTTNGSRIGQINGTIASNTSGTGLFSGWIDAVGVYNAAFGPDVIASIMNGTYQQSFGKTQALPAIPAAPTGLVAQGTSTPTTVTIHWTDNATNETSYQVYRSAVNNTNFLLRATLPANSNSFQDAGLFSNAVYYYEVRAVNSGGNSAFSNADSAHTKDNAPVLAPISNTTMRFGTSLALNVSASDVDAGTLTVTTSGMPAFGTYTSTGNGTGTLNFNPASTDQGVYYITVTVTDPNNGQASTSFVLTVNNNYPPVITRPVNNVSVNEKATGSLSLAATDQNSTDVLSWTFVGLPGFATTTITGGNVSIAMAPGYADGGSYVVKAIVTDGNQGYDSLNFTITVVPVPLPTVNTYIHFDGVVGTTAAAPWNNTAAQPAQNVAFTNLVDQNGANPLALTITTPWQSISYGDGTNVLGQTTGNNSGVYPDNVLGSGYFTDGTPQSISIAGLDTSTKYNFTFFGTRGGVNDDRTSIYSLSGTYVNQSVQLNAASNTATTVSINNVRPNADGTLTMTLAKGANAPFGYLNALVVTKQFNDHTAPAAPRSLTGQIVNNSELSLTWVAAAYNANSYQVYRSTATAGPYTLLNPGATSGTQASYVDTGLAQNNTYYYYATATNNYGVSPTSDTFMIAVPNLAPTLSAAVSGLSAPAGQTTTVNVTATDAPTDQITLAISGLPTWATFVDNGNGTGVLTLKPTSANIGDYTGSLTATDNHGAVSSDAVSINVTLANLRNVYVNFNDGTAVEPAQPAPWNNFNSAPNAGVSVANLKDDQGTTTNFTVTLVDAWAGSNNVGPTTGNNSGVYPDNVMQTLYYDDGGGVKRIKFTGLSPNAKYNVLFYAGRAGVTDDRIMYYNIGSDTVSLNAASNTSKTVEIDGVTPDASGTITALMWKDGGAAFEYINAMQLQYTYDTTFSSPSPLTATGPNTSSIKLQWGNNAPAITTGFELWRGTTPTGPFNLLATLSGTTTSYTDGGLSAGQSFFYEVRALAGSRQSSFSNVVGGSTVAYTVKIQFNDGADNPAQGGTWNSTNTLIFSGFQLPNMINTQSQPTGMNLNVISDFEGYNDFGATTGNNSGIFPDNVMNGFFYNDFGLTSTLSVSGLNLNSTYNFNFFGSRVTPSTAVISVYQIGNQIVTQDATNNTSQTVQIAGVKPDSTGTITFSVYAAVDGRCYLNAMTIDGVPNPISNFGQTPIATQAVHEGAVVATANALSITNTDSVAQAELSADTKAVAFPDPFVDAISLNLSLPKPVEKLLVTLVDNQGRVLFRQQLSNLTEGKSVVPLGINGSRLPAGSYYLLLQGLPDGKNRSLPLLKMNH